MNAGQPECVPGCGATIGWTMVSAVVSGPAPPPVTTGLTNQVAARWSVRPAAVSQPMGGQEGTAGTCTHTLDTGHWARGGQTLWSRAGWLKVSKFKTGEL